MKRSLLVMLAMTLVLVAANVAMAHFPAFGSGTQIFVWYEIADADVNDIDLKDASVADWEDVVGPAVLTAADMFADPTVGAGAPYNPSDMDYRFWFGWNKTRSICFAAMERTDDIFINEYAGGNLGDLWRHDGSLEFMLDGDHSGGDYTGSADPAWTSEEQTLNNNRTAQQIVGISDAPDGRHVGYQGAGNDWVCALPYADGGGGTTGTAPAVSVLEFYGTPFDDLIWNSPADSKASALSAGKIIGFQISIPDFDTAVADYRAFHTITGQAATWRYADRFTDGRLVASGDVTAVESSSWGRVKASLSK